MRSSLSEVTDYDAYLEAAWQQHCAARAPNAPTVISLFAGCGGSSLGYSMAGFRELLAVEWDANAVETFKLNFQTVPIYHGDITQLSIEQCWQLSGLETGGQLDVLDGSPPCQGFSIMGKREFGDQKNQLFKEYVRLLRALQPKIFVMENVPGMVIGKMKLIFADIMRALKSSGYAVSVRLLDASFFGVPQRRKRLIFIGVRDDLGIIPSHPVAKTRPVTVECALKNIVPTEIIRPHAGQMWAVEKCCPGEKLSKYHPKKHWFSYFRVKKDAPSSTIVKEHVGKIYHYADNRVLALNEIMTLCSFPRQFIMVGAHTNKVARLGNSVPPLLMRAIAEHIKANFLSHCC